MQTILSIVIYVAANAVGLLIATLLLPNFSIDFLSFVVVVLVFSLILAVLTPIIRKVSEKRMPALMGGIALVTVGAGLFLTNILMSGMSLGGIVNWIGATILVWIGSLIAGVILPRFIGKPSGGTKA